MFTAIMPAVTLGVAGAFAYSQYRKMKKKVPKNDSSVHPAQSLQQKDMDEQRADPSKADPVVSATPKQGANAAAPTIN